MIELENIEDNNENIKELSDNHLFNDSQRLKKLITNHLHYTDSKKADEILNNFEEYISKFKKVMPVEYKKVLLENMANTEEEKRL